jgi:hypothetical protein
VTTDAAERLTTLCLEFRLPTLASELVQHLVGDGHEALIPLVTEIFELEAGDRGERHVERLLRMSKLPPGKTLDTPDDARLPRPLLQQLRELARGEFLDCATNVLAFGLPGVGKSHVAAAIGHALVSSGRSYLLQRNHPGIETGLLFPSEAGTRPVGNDQLNDVWWEVQVMAEVERPVTIHGIRHNFHDLARHQRVPDAVVKAMAGRSGAEVAQRGSDKHLHYSRGVTVEEMRQASIGCYASWRRARSSSARVRRSPWVDDGFGRASASSTTAA